MVFDQILTNRSRTETVSSLCAALSQHGARNWHGTETKTTNPEQFFFPLLFLLFELIDVVWNRFQFFTLASR